MPKQKINGVLLLNKPLGFSSNQALQKIKWIYQAEKAGHTGTLDPLATGLLPICFGEATKFSYFLLDGDKEYIATVKLGTTTTTYDAEGEITASRPVHVTTLEIEACLPQFIGKITQVPPVYSALKVNGKALYEYARSGEKVAIKSRQIEIYELEILDFIDRETFRLRVLSSKGTYIRSLAHDIGEALGCGAHLVGLVRTKSNAFNVRDTFRVEQISNLCVEERLSLLLPMDTLVNDMPAYQLHHDQYHLILNGHQFNYNDKILNQNYRIYYKSQFLGIVDFQDGIARPIRLINMQDLRENAFS